MDATHSRELVETYVKRFTRTYKADGEGIVRKYDGATDDNFWAFSELDDICRTSPALALELILEILRTPHTDSVTEILAAGPLEDLLVNFGPTVIDEIELLARSDEAFRHLLGGVWTSGMEPTVGTRVQACSGASW